MELEGSLIYKITGDNSLNFTNPLKKRALVD